MNWLKRSTRREPSTEWAEFTTRLTRTIRDLDDRVFLIISDEASGAYVQFAADMERVSAECVDNQSGALKTKIDQAGEVRLLELGWSMYSVSEPNWKTSLGLPATTAQARHIANMCVAALREIFNVSSPDQLAYAAWRDPEPAWPVWMYEELETAGDDDDEYGEKPSPPDPGENPLLLPELGLKAEEPA